MVFFLSGALVASLLFFFLKRLKQKRVLSSTTEEQGRFGASSLIIEQAFSRKNIVIEKNPCLKLYSIKVSLFLSNPMLCEAVITKIFWTVWFSNLVHNGVSTREIVVPPQASHFEIKLSDVVEEKLFGALQELSGLAASGVQGFFEGKLFFKVLAGGSPGRIFSQVFSYCGFDLVIKGGEIEKEMVVFPKDSLTGLLTRQFLDTQFQSWIDTFVPAHVLSLLILDVDNFKPINDKYGHLVGDEVLRLLSREIQNFLKPEDFAIRYGGDEFVVLLQDKRIQEAEKIANELRTAVSMAPLTLETGQLLNFTISMGLAVINVRAPYTQWLKLADDVLRLAKKQGKNRLTINRRAPEVTF